MFPESAILNGKSVFILENPCWFKSFKKRLLQRDKMIQVVIEDEFPNSFAQFLAENHFDILFLHNLRVTDETAINLAIERGETIILMSTAKTLLVPEIMAMYERLEQKGATIVSKGAVGEYFETLRTTMIEVLSSRQRS